MRPSSGRVYLHDSQTHTFVSVSGVNVATATVILPAIM